MVVMLGRRREKGGVQSSTGPFYDFNGIALLPPTPLLSPQNFVYP